MTDREQRTENEAVHSYFAFLFLIKKPLTFSLEGVKLIQYEEIEAQMGEEIVSTWPTFLVTISEC